MDDVFLHVLRTRPDLAPSLFLRMGSALSGDEFALFLSGEASWTLRLKVIMAMPKWVFVRRRLHAFACFCSPDTPDTSDRKSDRMIEGVIASLGLANLLALGSVVLIGLPHGALTERLPVTLDIRRARNGCCAFWGFICCLPPP